LKREKKAVTHQDLYYSTVSRNRKKFLDCIEEDEGLRAAFSEITSSLNR
jgi:hypothetical protein